MNTAGQPEHPAPRPARLPRFTHANPMRTHPTIRIELNGTPRDIQIGATVAQVVAELGLRPEVVAVEVNRALVKRSEREQRALADGDAVEVVTLVGGG